MFYEIKFLLSLILTLILEIPILILFFKKLENKKIKLSKLIFIGFLASALTLPYLWFILPIYLHSLSYIILGEMFVIIVESLIYSNLLEIKFSKAIIFSLVCNLISFFIGLLIF